VEGADVAKGADAAKGAARRRRLSYNERRELEALPERVSALEDEQKRLKEEVAGPDFYKSAADHIHAVLARIDAVDAELHAALERWMELEALGSSS
jgi:ATP-binding cassette subfamily F protein uup